MKIYYVLGSRGESGEHFVLKWYVEIQEFLPGDCSILKINLLAHQNMTIWINTVKTFDHKLVCMTRCLEPNGLRVLNRVLRFNYYMYFMVYQAFSWPPTPSFLSASFFFLFSSMCRIFEKVHQRNACEQKWCVQLLLNVLKKKSLVLLFNSSLLPRTGTRMWQWLTSIDQITT